MAKRETKPERLPPAQMEPALISEAELTTQDLKDVSNIHEANLGMPSNEVSGAAIIARQRVSDTGTVLYQDNCSAAVEEAGRVIDQLIPICYDTIRTIKVLGVDGDASMQVINDSTNPDSIDIGIGNYSVSAITGPSTATKRIEAADGIMTFLNAAPQVAAYTLDLVAEAMDWPMHTEIARRIRLTLPPGMVDPKDMTPDMVARQQQQAQTQQQQAQMQFHMAIAKYLNMQSSTELNSARAANFETEASLAPGRAQNEAVSTASQAAERDARTSIEAQKVAKTP